MITKNLHFSYYNGKINVEYKIYINSFNIKKKRGVIMKNERFTNFSGVKRLAFVSIAFVLIVSVLSSCITIGSTDRFVKAVAEGDFRKANEIYQERIEGNLSDEVKASEMLNEMLQDSLNEFAEDKINYETLQMRLTAAENVRGVNINTSNIYYEANFLNDSKIAYNTAIEYFDDELYQYAMEELKKVIEEDSNYYDAQELYEEAVDLFRIKVVENASKM